MPSGTQRRAPFTPLPSPGMSTSTSNTIALAKTHGARRCQVAIGTWNATIAAQRPIASEVRWRIRKYVGATL
jgi:hypothetical protein